MFLNLNEGVRAQLADPASNKTVKLTITASGTPGASSGLNNSEDTMKSIDEVLALASQAEVDLPSGDDFLNSFDNLLGDMNKALSDSTVAEQQQAAASASTAVDNSANNAAFLAELASLEEQQTVNKKKTMRTRDLNAFLEAEFAGIGGIGEPQTAPQPVAAEPAPVAVQEVPPQQLQQASPPQQQVAPGSPTSTASSPSTMTEEDELHFSVSQRAEMARTLAMAKQNEVQAQQVKVTAVTASKKDKKDKKDKKEKKDKKDKKMKGGVRETMSEDFSSVTNPAFESTDRAGLNPLFLNTSGSTPQSGMETGAFVSPLASATPRGGNMAVPASPRGINMSPRSPGAPASPRTGTASPQKTTITSVNAPAVATPQVAPQATTAAPASSFTKAARPTASRPLRREHTIGTRASQMFTSSDVAAALAANEAATQSSAPTEVAQPAQTHTQTPQAAVSDRSVSESSTDSSSSAAVEPVTVVVVESTPVAPVDVAPVESLIVAEPVAVAVVEPSAPAAVATPVGPTDEEKAILANQEALLAQQRQADEERARVDRETAARYTHLMAQQKALEEQREALALAQQQALEEHERNMKALADEKLAAEKRVTQLRESFSFPSTSTSVETKPVEAIAEPKAVEEPVSVVAVVAVEPIAAAPEPVVQVVIAEIPAAQAPAAQVAPEEPKPIVAERAASPAAPEPAALPTFVSQTPTQDYPDPTSISAMLHEQLDQLLMEAPSTPSNPPSAAPTSHSVASSSAPVAAPSQPAAAPPLSEKEESSLADDMDQLLADLDRPYNLPSSEETKHEAEQVPTLREPGPKPEEPPPSNGLTHPSTSQTTPTDAPPGAVTTRRRKKKKRRVRPAEENPTGTFSVARKRKKKRRVNPSSPKGSSDKSPPTSGTSDNFVVVAPLKEAAQDSDSDSDDEDFEDSSGGGNAKSQRLTPPSSAKVLRNASSSMGPSSSSQVVSQAAPASHVISRTNSSRNTTTDGSSIQRSPSAKSLGSVKIDLRSQKSDDSVLRNSSTLSSSSSPSLPMGTTKKKFKRAKKRNFDEEVDHRRKMNYQHRNTAAVDGDEEETEVLDTGYVFRTSRPSSAFRFAEKDELLWFHLSLHRMSMMRQAPFWMTEPASLAAERNSFKLANSMTYPWNHSPAPPTGVAPTLDVSTSLNVMVHLFLSCSPSEKPRKLRTILKCHSESSVLQIRTSSYAQFRDLLAAPSSTDGSALLKPLEDYVLQMTDTPIFVIDEQTTLKQLMVSASKMHVEQFTLVERVEYDNLRSKASEILRLIEGDSPDLLPADSILPDFAPGPGSPLFTPTWSPSDSEEMHFRKNSSRNTVVLVRKVIQPAAITTAPIPPYISSKILTTIHLEAGSSSILAAGPNSTVSELIEDAKKKFKLQGAETSVAYVLKICGRKEYITQQNLPLHRIEYIRKQLERKRKIHLQLVRAESIGCTAEQIEDASGKPSSVIHMPWEAAAKPLEPTNIDADSLEHPLSPRNFKPSDSTATLKAGATMVVGSGKVAESSDETAPMLMDASQVETPNQRAKRLRRAQRRASLYYPTTMPFSIPSNMIKQAFEIKICSADALLFGEATRGLDLFQLSFYVEVGLYFGGEPLVKSETTSGLPWSDVLTWDQVLVFPSICLGDIPKETRLCLTLYGQPKGDPIPLGWVSCRLYDFHDVLASGPFNTNMWPDEAANPIGYCGSCPATRDKNTYRLKVEFESFSVPVTYSEAAPPPIARVLEKKKSSGRKTRLQYPVPNEEMKLELQDIAGLDPLFYPDNRERELIWGFREWLKDAMPTALNKLALSVPWTDPVQVQVFYRLLESWPKIDPQNALELLDARYANERVREYAVLCLENWSDAKLATFMLQLVQVLKYEINHYSILAQFLLDRALENEMVIGQRLFWFLKAELHVPETRERFALLIESLMLRCSAELREQLIQQVSVVSTLKECALKVKTFPEARRTEMIRKMLAECTFPALFTLPLDPLLELSGSLDVTRCRCFDSAKAPILLAFRSGDPCIGKEADVHIIFKAGDDLRQDSLTLQMLTLMDQLWKQAGLDLHMTPYLVAVTGDGTGLIEVVQDSVTTAKIQMEKGFLGAFSEKPLHTWLKTANPAANDFEAAVDNFVLSCAGYCVATYVLGIGDRHNDNIMVDRKGHFFHIDFGHFLGNYKSWAGLWDREKAPFVFTSEFAFVMDGKDSDKYRYFVRQCQRAYNIVRQHANLLMNLFVMMLSTGIPELRSAADLLYLQDALATHLTDSEAGDFFLRLIESSLSSATTRINGFIHLVAHN